MNCQAMNRRVLMRLSFPGTIRVCFILENRIVNVVDFDVPDERARQRAKNYVKRYGVWALVPWHHILRLGNHTHPDPVTRERKQIAWEFVCDPTKHWELAAADLSIYPIFNGSF